jgi:flavodoxin I
MGNTEQAAKLIQKSLGRDSEVVNVTELAADTLGTYDTLLFGSSTWGDGELQDDWEKGVKILQEADLAGKKVGFFGCGDQYSYPDTFADAVGIIYKAVSASGAAFIGQWPTEGYDFTKSEAVVDGKFVGLILDEENQSDLTARRIEEWTALLK